MKRILLTLLAIGLCAMPLAALADTSVDVQDETDNFNSPANGVGPWQTRTLTVRNTGGTRDTPGLIFIDRVDADSAAPQHSNAVLLDDYHNWTPGFFTYIALGTSAGGILPTRSAYLEGDLKAGSLVMGAAAATFVNPNATVLNQVSFGPTYYWPTVNAGFRYMPGWINPGGFVGTYLFTVTEGIENRATTTLTLQAGAQPPYNNPLLTGTDQRAYAGSALFKRWIGRLGLDAGVDYAYVTRPSNGTLIYIQRGVTLGAFVSIK